MTQFSDFQISDALKQRIAALNYITPTPVQAGAVPPALEGRDVLAFTMQGSAVDKILREARDQNAGLIVMGGPPEAAAHNRQSFYLDPLLQLACPPCAAPSSHPPCSSH